MNSFFSLNCVRFYAGFSRKIPKGWKEEGVKYEKIMYYPRHPDHVDPSFEPSKLLMVTRVKPWWGNPWWEKKTLISLGFEEEKRGRDVVIVKNTPTVCAMLWSVKHLVKIVPIKLPKKLPTEDDLDGTYLHESGTFSVIPKVDSARLEATKKFMNDEKRLDRDLISEKLRLQWLRGDVIL